MFGGVQSGIKDEVEFPVIDERGGVDWTRLPDDVVVFQIFPRLNYCDRACLSSTCTSFHLLGKSPSLWRKLDLRDRKWGKAAASLLASRCENLRELRFRGDESAGAIEELEAKGLRDISGECCGEITDARLRKLAAQHEALESLQMGPDSCERISSNAVEAIAICCPKLRKLRLSGIHEVDADAINTLAKHCHNLTDIGFIDCRKVDETALGEVASIRFLSVAGTTNINWNLMVQQWSNLPCLIGLDVSRTDISPDSVSRLLSSSSSLKVLYALNCPALEGGATFVTNDDHKGTVLLADFTDIRKGVQDLSDDAPKNDRNILLHWRKSEKGKKLDEILNWLAWIICNSLLRVSQTNPPGLDNFWLNQGITLLLSFIQSAQEDVQERAATALANIVAIAENAHIDNGRAEAVVRGDGIRILLKLAQSWPEGLQSEAAKAIANLTVNAKAAKAVADEGGISILAKLARSDNRLSNLSVGKEHQAARALVNLAAYGDILGQLTSSNHDGVRLKAAGALWNLSLDDRNREIITAAGGVEALAFVNLGVEDYLAMSPYDSLPHESLFMGHLITSIESTLQ